MQVSDGIGHVERRRSYETRQFSIWSGVLYRFHDAQDGGEPFGGVILDAAGNLYSTTSTAGSGFGIGLGTVFKLDKTGKETQLYSFTNMDDGVGPASPVI